MRRHSSEKLKNVLVKQGINNELDFTSTRLILAENIQEAEWESNNLIQLLAKSRRLHYWNRVKDESKHHQKLRQHQNVADTATRDMLEKALMHDEKEILMQQEQESLRKLLGGLERECESLRKQLKKEHKLTAQRSHAQLQEAHSMRHLELAKTSNLEKLTAELKVKDRELRSLKDLNHVDQKHTSRSASELRRLLKQTVQQVNHERSLKLSAFERVDELQKQVHDFEVKTIDSLNRDKPYHETCFPLVPGGRISPVKGRSLCQAASLLPLEYRPKTEHKQRPKSGRFERRPQSVGALLKTNKSEMHISNAPTTRRTAFS